jgi:hypothetical protein
MKNQVLGIALTLASIWLAWFAFSYPDYPKYPILDVERNSRID